MAKQNVIEVLPQLGQAAQDGIISALADSAFQLRAVSQAGRRFVDSTLRHIRVGLRAPARPEGAVPTDKRLHQALQLLRGCPRCTCLTVELDGAWALIDSDDEDGENDLDFNALVHAATKAANRTLSSAFMRNRSAQQLTEITVSGQHGRFAMGTSVLLSLAVGCPQLRTLHLRDGVKFPEGAQVCEALAHLPHLEVLSLPDCVGMASASLLPPTLTRLVLGSLDGAEAELRQEGAPGGGLHGAAAAGLGGAGMGRVPRTGVLAWVMPKMARNFRAAMCLLGVLPALEFLGVYDSTYEGFSEEERRVEREAKEAGQRGHHLELEHVLWALRDLPAPPALRELGLFQAPLDDSFPYDSYYFSDRKLQEAEVPLDLPHVALAYAALAPLPSGTNPATSGLQLPLPRLHFRLLRLSARRTVTVPSGMSIELGAAPMDEQQLASALALRKRCGELGLEWLAIDLPPVSGEVLGQVLRTVGAPDVIHFADRGTGALEFKLPPQQQEQQQQQQGLPLEVAGAPAAADGAATAGQAGGSSGEEVTAAASAASAVAAAPLPSLRELLLMCAQEAEAHPDARGTRLLLLSEGVASLLAEVPEVLGAWLQGTVGAGGRTVEWHAASSAACAAVVNLRSADEAAAALGEMPTDMAGKPLRAVRLARNDAKAVLPVFKGYLSAAQPQGSSSGSHELQARLGALVGAWGELMGVLTKPKAA